jgi:hypothetical protein
VNFKRINKKKIMTSVSSTLDFKMGDISHSTYRMTKLVPQVSGPHTVGGSNNTITFELPPSAAYNLSRSSLEFTATPTAGGGTFYNYLYEIPGIERLQLVTRSGQSLIDLVNFQEYMQTVAKLEKSLDDFNTSDELDLISRSNSLDAKLASGADTTLPYNDFKQWTVGTVDSATPVVSKKIKLGDFKGTFCALDICTLYKLGVERDVYYKPRCRCSRTSR